MDGKVREVEEQISLDKNKKHNIEVVVDRLVVEDKVFKRLADSIETALRMGSGVVLIDRAGEKEILYSERYACVHCNISY